MHELGTSVCTPPVPCEEQPEVRLAMARLACATDVLEHDEVLKRWMHKHCSCLPLQGEPALLALTPATGTGSASCSAHGMDAARHHDSTGDGCLLPVEGGRHPRVFLPEVQRRLWNPVAARSPRRRMRLRGRSAATAGYKAVQDPPPAAAAALRIADASYKISACT